MKLASHYTFVKSTLALVGRKSQRGSVVRRFYFVHPEGTCNNEQSALNDGARRCEERTDGILGFVEHCRPASEYTK